MLDPAKRPTLNVAAIYANWREDPASEADAVVAATQFFGDPDAVPDREDRHAWLRYIEWLVLDHQLATGGKLFDNYAKLASPEEQPLLAELAGHRHDAWQLEGTSPAWSLKPSDKGPALPLDPAETAVIDLARGDVLVGRLYPGQSGWRVSSASVVTDLPLDLLDTSPLDALAWQRIDQVTEHASDAEPAVGSVVTALFDAVRAKDEAALRKLLLPDSGLDLVFDLWGWPGVELFCSGSEPIPAWSIWQVDASQPQSRLVEVHWEGSRGALVYLVAANEGWQVADVRPSVQEDGKEHVAPAFLAAERGVRLGWQGAAPDAVEQKLRNAATARTLPIDRQRGLIQTWRMFRQDGLDLRQPEAWAAAVDMAYSKLQEEYASLTDVANGYGAKKSLVKTRLEEMAAKPPGVVSHYLRR